MKKDNLKIISAGLAGILVGSIGVVCANQAIQAIQNTQIKVSLNGQVQEFKDETTGETQYPITYHDRTYLPLRNVSQLAGLDVDYDSNTNMALLSTKPITNPAYVDDYGKIISYNDGNILINSNKYIVNGVNKEVERIISLNFDQKWPYDVIYLLTYDGDVFYGEIIFDEQERKSINFVKAGIPEKVKYLYKMNEYRIMCVTPEKKYSIDQEGEIQVETSLDQDIIKEIISKAEEDIRWPLFANGSYSSNPVACKVRDIEIYDIEYMQTVVDCYDNKAEEFKDFSEEFRQELESKVTFFKKVLEENANNLENIPVYGNITFILEYDGDVKGEWAGNGPTFLSGNKAIGSREFVYQNGELTLNTGGTFD